MPNHPISVLARALRRAIESVPPDERPITLSAFPRGSCGDASLLLGAYLADSGVNGFMYVCGGRGSRERNTWTSHAWLAKGSCVVDITADQFEDSPSPIIIADPSRWHSQFITEPPQPSDLRSWHGNGVDSLRAFYNKLCSDFLGTNT